MPSLFNSRRKSVDQFERIIKPHLESLYRFAYRLSGSRSEAEELVQAYLVRLYPKVEQLLTIEKLTPWLNRGLYRLYVDSFRKNMRELRIFDTETNIDELIDSRHTSVDHSERAELSDIINTALQQLNNDQRVVVLLHDSEGYTLEELSHILETPVGTLKSRLHRARSNLRNIIALEPFDYFGRVEDTEGN